MARAEYKKLQSPTGLCGGTQKSFTYYEALQNGRTLIGWKVTSPSTVGNCTIRISDSPNADKMKTLRPLDGSANELGAFPCGRQESNFEAKEVRMPREFDCDSCILEVQWQTEKGKYSYCSDILVTGGLTQECPGICQNGGICSNGECNCQEAYEGTFC